MSKPVRIQRRRVKGWRMPPNSICVDRPSQFGNPFVVSEWRTAAEAVDLYRAWLTGKRRFRSANLAIQRSWILSHLGDIRRCEYVAAWCPLDQPCHADVLLEFANDLPEPRL